MSVEQVRERTDAVTLSDGRRSSTSGTTGIPKGGPHAWELYFTDAGLDFLPVINDPKSRSLLFLPVAHVLARFVMYCLLAGQGIYRVLSGRPQPGRRHRDVQADDASCRSASWRRSATRPQGRAAA